MESAASEVVCLPDTEPKVRRYEYIVRLVTLVPVDRKDMLTEIVENVYGPVAAEVLSYAPIKP